MFVYSYSLFLKLLRDVQPTYLPPIDQVVAGSMIFNQPQSTNYRQAFPVYDLPDNNNNNNNNNHNTINTNNIKKLEESGTLGLHLSDFETEVGFVLFCYMLYITLYIFVQDVLFCYMLYITLYIFVQDVLFCYMLYITLYIIVQDVLFCYMLYITLYIFVQDVLGIIIGIVCSCCCCGLPFN